MVRLILLTGDEGFSEMLTRFNIYRPRSWRHPDSTKTVHDGTNTYGDQIETPQHGTNTAKDRETLQRNYNATVPNGDPHRAGRPEAARPAN